MNTTHSARSIKSSFEVTVRQRPQIKQGVIRVMAVLALLAFARFTPEVFAQGNPDEGWTRVDQSLALNLSQINACYQSELVKMTGVLSGVTRTKIQPDGSLTVKESLSLAATGVGTVSGADYTLSDVSVNRTDGLGSFPLAIVINRVSKLVGNGVPDLYLHFKFRIVFDSNGNITHDIQYVNGSCNP